MKTQVRRQAQRGQSTLEYALVLGAILAALVGVAAAVMRPAVQKTMNDSAEILLHLMGNELRRTVCCGAI